MGGLHESMGEIIWKRINRDFKDNKKTTITKSKSIPSKFRKQKDRNVNNMKQWKKNNDVLCDILNGSCNPENFDEMEKQFLSCPGISCEEDGVK